ncbi:glycosyltransferase family 9 protein [Desulfoplanes formicivorans]|uniref:Glycosyl transferase n=1 Tax=Desulfoplanes formicivorans TaxID=1592317 RepID=A0A194AK12_9BACT|nr:glycosyltransferase family 9 protein [Desulfoplanes formicivorans]GAU09396.1 hypothetical protein DPF_2122 [Desulfoplanes formicivorans]
MNTDKRFILVHQGALGDFLMTWPVLASLRKALPTSALFWAGSSARLPLLHPLDITYASPALLRTVRLLHLGDVGSSGLVDANDLIIWFVLREKPALIKHENIFFLHGMDKGTCCPPWKMFARGLTQHNIPFDPQWQTTFQTMFPRQVRQGDKRILLFPGSGNPAKNWPLVQFLELADWLQNQGWHPIMVLGPVEQETGLALPETMERACPETIHELIALLQQAVYVIGNDSGPMHLAGYMGIRGLSIFGPTSPEQWGPLGMDVLSLRLACSPCTRTARIVCPDPVCIHNITLDQVIARIRPALARLFQAP